MKKIRLKKIRMKKTACLAAAAAVLLAGVSAGNALAYFTTYTQAAGGMQLDLGFTTSKPKEEISSWTKHVAVENTGTYACFIRVQAFAGSRYAQGLTYSGEDWTPGDDGYYYYNSMVEPGERTKTLDIFIDHTQAEENFNVIVIQESAPAAYDDNGNAYGDWDRVLESIESSEGTQNSGEVGEE